MKTLIYDTELSYKVVATFDLHDVHISPNNIIHDWFFFCFAYKWLGQKKVYDVSLLDDLKRFKADFRDDRHVVQQLYNLMLEADCIVAHNNNGFDWKRFMARVVYHGLPPFPQPLMVDTLKDARKFGFSSKALGYLGKHLDLGEKRHHENDAFLSATLGDADAIRDLVRYCRGDIPPCEALYLRLRPYSKGHPNMGHYSNSPCCPACGSERFAKNGTRKVGLSLLQRFKCSNPRCGVFFDDGKALRRVKFRTR